MLGICGTGKMGSAMTERLMDEGESLAVWNRTEKRARPLVERGARLMESPAALAAECETVIVMLFDDAAIPAVYDGGQGLLAADLSGRLIIEMSTILPQTAADLATRVRDAGAAFVECPVGGTVAPARNGKLLGMAGASAEDFTRAQSVLEKLCRRVERVGDPGTGAAMKLAVNLPLIVYWEALGEALSLCDGAGIDRELAADILMDSSGAIAVAKQRVPGILSVAAGETPVPGNFALAGSVKDLGLVKETARRFGITATVAEAAQKAYEGAVADGWGSLDFTMQAAWRVVQRRSG
jgi:3-hydroxyisobutyrate dehydrogenase